MLILSLSLSGLCSKSACLSPGFCVKRPRQYDTICWELSLISGLFVFFWLIGWADEINKCGWWLARGRGCWVKCPHPIPSVSWIYHHSFNFHIYQIASFAPGIVCPLYRYYNWWGDGIGGGGWVITGCGKSDNGWALSCSFCFCFLFSLVFLSFVLSCPLSLF